MSCSFLFIDVVHNTPINKTLLDTVCRHPKDNLALIPLLSRPNPVGRDWRPSWAPWRTYSIESHTNSICGHKYYMPSQTVSNCIRHILAQPYTYAYIKKPARLSNVSKADKAIKCTKSRQGYQMAQRPKTHIRMHADKAAITNRII